MLDYHRLGSAVPCRVADLSVGVIESLFPDRLPRLLPQFYGLDYRKSVCAAMQVKLFPSLSLFA